MRAKTSAFALLLAAVLTLAACNLPRPTSTAADTVPPVEPTPGPTPTLAGPAIPHLAPGQGVDLLQVHMLDPYSGWGLGGLDQARDHVFRTADGGLTWQDVTPPQPAAPAGEQASALGAFQDASTAWVVYENTSFPPPAYVFLWSTGDGGATWQYAALDTSVSLEYFSPWFLEFADHDHGWLLAYEGSGMGHDYVGLLASGDGGRTWTSLVNHQDGQEIQNCPKSGLAFFDADHGWLARQCGGQYTQPVIDRTIDGGASWAAIPLPAPAGQPDLDQDYLCDPFSPNPISAQALVVGMTCRNLLEPDLEMDFLLGTSDGGASWTVFPLPPDYRSGGGLAFFDPLNGFAFGRRIYRTADGGRTWTFVQQVYWDGQFSFVTPSLGWAAVVSYDEQGTKMTALVRTENGGVTWELLNPMLVP